MYENDSAKREHQKIMEQLNAYELAEMEKNRNEKAYEMFKIPPYYLYAFDNINLHIRNEF